MSSLPTEIIINILTREPIKDLLRFRCVSKPWCSLIDDPDFIKLHLKRSTQTYSLQNLILKHDKLYSLNVDSEKVAKLDHPLKKSPKAEVLGSCNGLVCLLSENDDLALWNPSTKKHHVLPVSPIRLSNYEFATYAFGYDHVNGDYKVMRIAQRGAGEGAGGGGSFKTEVVVYSLKLNAWKKVDKFPYELCFKDWGAFLSGAFHFMGTSESHPPISYIVAFDLAVEKYRLVPLPEHVDKNMFVMHVGVLGGCLYLNCNWPASDIDIWVMKDYGVKASWAKLICIPPEVIRSNYGYVKPLAYSKNGNAVLLAQELQVPDHVKLHWYDLEKKTLTNLKIRGIPIFFEAMSFVGSLVPLKDDRAIGKQQEVEPKGRKKKKNGNKRDDFLSAGFKLVL